jgi:glucose-6-phosphate dehydrogenase assembly protein OpcA
MAGPGGPVAAEPAVPGRPVLRWSSRTDSIPGIEAELARIWASVSLTAPSEGGEQERWVAPRSSVMNLVVIAGKGEVGERVAAIIEGLTGRHPSRTLIVSQADPDGPPWLDAKVQAHCMLPSEDAAETCAELVYVTAGGETGQHLAGVVAPLLIHDLPVTIWWPDEPRFDAAQARDLLELADRVLVDGSSWSGEGLARLASMARLPATYGVQVADFGLLRQARWREAIASTFDRPNLLPFVHGLESIEVSYASRNGIAGATNVVKPLYHVAWLASRLAMSIASPLSRQAEPWGGYQATLRAGRRTIPVALKPIRSSSPPGTTLTVELVAARRSKRLAIEVTAQADGVTVRADLDGAAMPERRFLAPRRREADLLAETIEGAAGDTISAGALAMATALIGGGSGVASRR